MNTTNRKTSSSTGTSSTARARLQIILAAICWGLIPLFYHSMSAAGLTRMQAITMRFTFAAIGYVVCLGIQDKTLLRIQKPAHLLYFVGTGIGSLALFNFCYITCIQLAGVAVAALLLYTAPVFVLLLSALLFREKISGRGLLALGMTIAGCAFVAGIASEQVALTKTAFLWGLGSGFGYALYSIFSKFALRDYTAETITAYTAVFAAIATFPFSRPLALLHTLSAHPTALWSAIGCALFCTVVAYRLYTTGLLVLPAAQASILATIEPVVASILGVLLLQESMTFSKLGGMALILGSIVVLGLPARRVSSNQILSQKPAKGAEASRTRTNGTKVGSTKANGTKAGKTKKGRKEDHHAVL